MTEFSILDFVTSICVNRDWSLKSNVFMETEFMETVSATRLLIHERDFCMFLDTRLQDMPD